MDFLELNQLKNNQIDVESKQQSWRRNIMKGQNKYYRRFDGCSRRAHVHHRLLFDCPVTNKNNTVITNNNITTNTTTTFQPQQNHQHHHHLSTTTKPPTPPLPFNHNKTTITTKTTTTNTPRAIQVVPHWGVPRRHRRVSWQHRGADRRPREHPPGLPTSARPSRTPQCLQSWS